MNRRPIPPAAVRDTDSIEILTAWVAEEGLHCALRTGLYENSGVDEKHAWGIILADITRHISNALADSEGTPDGSLEIVEAIRTSYLKELESPSSAVAGSFVAQADERPRR